MPTIVLIRPGCTDFDEQKRIQGRLDLPLNSRGETQVQQLIQQLRPLDVELIYTTPCSPARETAELIGEELQIRVKETKALQSVDQGLWQGMSLEEIQRKFPKTYKKWLDSPETICPPEGEMMAAVVERINKALQKPLKKKHPVAIVAPEPLATLISGIIRGESSTVIGPICGGPPDCSLEIIHHDGPTKSAVEPLHGPHHALSAAAAGTGPRGEQLT